MCLVDAVDCCRRDWETGVKMLITRSSCEDEDTAQSKITRRAEVALATIWKGVVCWVYDIDHRQLFESRHTYVGKESS